MNLTNYLLKIEQINPQTLKEMINIFKKETVKTFFEDFINNIIANDELTLKDKKKILKMFNNFMEQYQNESDKNIYPSFINELFYTKEDFDDEAQKELASYYRELNKNNVKVMLSNSNPKNTNKDDFFFENIYGGFNINKVYAKRMINANSKGRGEISELLITNYKTQYNGEIKCIEGNTILNPIASN